MALRKFTSRRIGDAIRGIRLALNLSQTEFGIEVGNYSQDTVAKWESGQVPHAMVLKWISELSDPFRSVDWILSQNTLKRQSIAEGLGPNGDGSQERVLASLPAQGRDRALTRDRVRRNLPCIDRPHDDPQKAVPYVAVNRASNSGHNPFEMLTEQIRALVRDEILSVLDNRARTAANSSPGINSTEWLRTARLARRNNRRKHGLKRRAQGDNNTGPNPNGFLHGHNTGGGKSR